MGVVTDEGNNMIEKEKGVISRLQKSFLILEGSKASAIYIIFITLCLKGLMKPFLKGF